MQEHFGLDFGLRWPIVAESILMAEETKQVEQHSLAEFLGTAPLSSGSREPRLEDITDSKSFALAVLSSREFRQYIVNGLILGELPSAVVCRMMDYAWGKPVERVEVKDTTMPAESLTAEQLEERATRLSEMARFLRRAEQFDEPLTSESVH